MVTGPRSQERKWWQLAFDCRDPGPGVGALYTPSRQVADAGQGPAADTLAGVKDPEGSYQVEKRQEYSVGEGMCVQRWGGVKTAWPGWSMAGIESACDPPQPPGSQWVEMDVENGQSDMAPF